jgi:hypothetical protein
MMPTGAARNLSSVWLFFDESGDFAFPEDRFDAYTQAVVICPDSKLATVDAWAAQKRGEWDVRELHGTELSDEQVFEVCRFMRAAGIAALVQATDTHAVSRRDIEHHRLTQAVRLHENLGTWRAGGGQGTAIPKFYERLVKANAYLGRVSHTEWVQANALVDLFHRGINKAVGVYHDDRYRPDFEEFRFVLDAKLPGKLAPGEKHLDQVLLGYLARSTHPPTFGNRVGAATGTPVHGELQQRERARRSPQAVRARPGIRDFARPRRSPAR